MASKKRSLLKAVTWRLAGSMTTISVVWIYTSNVQLSVCAATIDLFVKIMAYYVHERVWDKIDFGRDSISAKFDRLLEDSEKLIRDSEQNAAVLETLKRYDQEDDSGVILELKQYKGEDQNGQ